MENKTKSNFLFLSLSILAGFFLLGFYVYKGLKTFSDKDRVVTVKGLAEMFMKAESASVSIYYSFSGDNLDAILAQSEEKKKAVLAYLTTTAGYDADAISIHTVDVNDRERYYETQWRSGKEVEVKIDRYTVSQGLSIKTKDVENTEKRIAAMKFDLISKQLTSDISVEYFFPDLNTIKPQLIAESTKNARIAGEQFANDSQAKLGKIKTASQGQITIAGRYYYDEESDASSQAPYMQKARVVSTIVFFLE